jgi:short-subunit dehydrogenase
MQSLQLNKKWVLITGASSGLGYEMASQLALLHKANLILVARRKDRLEELKAKLQGEAGVQIKTISVDLSRADDAEQMITEVLQSTDLYGAILNAGVTYFGRNTDITPQQFDAILQTNVVSTIRMTNRIVDHFEKTKKAGALMLVSSMAALFPVPYQAAYSASKAFVLSYGKALSAELKNPNFSITVFAPGGIATEMTEGKSFHGLKKWLMPVKDAAKEGLYGFIKRKLVYVPGFTNRLGNVFMKFLPTAFITRTLGGVYEKALLESEK